MRIDDFNRLTPNPSTSTKTPLPADAANQPIVGQTDGTDLSNLAAGVVSKGASPERLEQLRQAVEAGRYLPPAAEVAGKLIDSHVVGEAHLGSDAEHLKGSDQ